MSKEVYDKPIVIDLNYTNEQISEVRRAQLKVVLTKRKETIRNILGA